MALKASEIVPKGEVLARLTGSAEAVPGSGAGKVLTENGASCIALVHALSMRRQRDLHQLGSASPTLP